MAEDLFAPATIEYDPNTSYVDELVGEGKKFTDPNKLAYSKIESDRFIDRLKQENEAMRKDLTARQRLEDIATKLSTFQPPIQQQSASNEDNQNSERDSNKGSSQMGLTSEQAEQLVTAKLTERENYQRSLTGLKQTLGSDYQPKLDAEAKRLGLSSEEVNSLAKANPELFLTIFGKTEANNELAPLPTSGYNSAANTNSTNRFGAKTESYYAELKTKDPQKYWSKSIQNQEYQDALKLGEAYFDKRAR